MARSAGRTGGWHWFVPVAALVAGVLFATSAETAAGTDLRAGRRSGLPELIGAQERRVGEQSDLLTRLQAETGALQAQVGDAEVAAAQRAADSLAPAVGLTPVVGPGLSVVLDDAPTRADGTLPVGARADDVVVHQSDLQAVVNAVWAGGASGVTLMGERIIATSAVRCVGNTLLLHGRTYSPPFRVDAVGDVGDMTAQLDASAQVALFRQAVDYFGLGYDVSTAAELTLPPYAGPLEVSMATAVPR